MPSFSLFSSQDSNADASTEIQNAESIGTPKPNQKPIPLNRGGWARLLFGLIIILMSYVCLFLSLTLPFVRAHGLLTSENIDHEFDVQKSAVSSTFFFLAQNSDDAQDTTLCCCYEFICTSAHPSPCCC